MLVGAVYSVRVAVLASSGAYVVVVKAVAPCSGHALVMRLLPDLTCMQYSFIAAAVCIGRALLARFVSCH